MDCREQRYKIYTPDTHPKIVLLHIIKPITKMKRTLFLTLILTIIVLTGCNKRNAPFTTLSMEGKRSFYVKTNDPYLPEGLNPFGVENSYTLVWPTKGMISKEAEKELIMQVFGDSTAHSANEAAQRWLNNLWLFEDTKALEAKTVDSVSGESPYTYARLNNSIEKNENLVTFINTTEIFLAGAAHGSYIVEYLTYDRKTKRVVHLNDLVDTSKLGEIVVRAIEDLVVNKDVQECLFDEYLNAEKFPLTDNFFIDSTRSTITLVYQQYDIAPYACGLPSVVMPIFWLSKHTELTPYAKKLFGKGSYLE